MLTAQTVRADAPPDADRALRLLNDIADATDPDAAFLALPEADRDLDIWASTPVGEGTREYTLDDDSGVSGDSDDMPACRTHIREKYKTNPLGIQYLTYQSYTWWCRLDGEIHGDPEFSASGSVHRLFRITWSFRGNDYTSEAMASDRSWHSDEAQGSFDNCIPSPIPGVSICVVGWTVQINKKHYGDGQQESW